MNLTIREFIQNWANNNIDIFTDLVKFISNLRNYNGLFVSTAHPIKFKDTVENSINSQIEYPDSIRSIMNKEKSTLTMKSYSELKEYLIQKD